MYFDTSVGMCLCVAMHNSFWENIFFTENNLVYKIQDNSYGQCFTNIQKHEHIYLFYIL